MLVKEMKSFHVNELKAESCFCINCEDITCGSISLLFITSSKSPPCLPQSFMHLSLLLFSSTYNVTLPPNTWLASAKYFFVPAFFKAYYFSTLASLIIHQILLLSFRIFLLTKVMHQQFLNTCDYFARLPPVI